MEGFDFDGVFWLPEDPNQVVAGRVTFDPEDGVNLALIGSFGDVAGALAANVVTREVILGVAGKQQLTLVNSRRLGFTLETPGVQRERYRAEVVLSGHHFTRSEEIVFDEVHVWLGSLDRWVEKSAIEVSLTFGHSQEGLVESVATLRPLPPEISLGDEEDVALHYDYSFSGNPIHEYKLGSGCHLRISTANARPLREVIDDAGRLQDLLTLLAGRAVPLQKITLMSQDLEHDAFEKYRLKSISFYAALPSSWIPDKPVQTHEMLSTYAQIGAVAAIHRWLAVSRRFSRVLNSILSIRYARQIYAENRFQNSVSAGETFHRMRFANFLTPPHEYRAF